MVSLENLRKEIRQEYGCEMKSLRDEINNIKGTINTVKSLGWILLFGIPLLNNLFEIMREAAQKATGSP